MVVKASEEAVGLVFVVDPDGHLKVDSRLPESCKGVSPTRLNTGPPVFLQIFKLPDQVLAASPAASAEAEKLTAELLASTKVNSRVTHMCVAEPGAVANTMKTALQQALEQKTAPKTDDAKAAAKKSKAGAKKPALPPPTFSIVPTEAATRPVGLTVGLPGVKDVQADNGDIASDSEDDEDDEGEDTEDTEEDDDGKEGEDEDEDGGDEEGEDEDDGDDGDEKEAARAEKIGSGHRQQMKNRPKQKGAPLQGAGKREAAASQPHSGAGPSKRNKAGGKLQDLLASRARKAQMRRKAPLAGKSQRK